MNNSEKRGQFAFRAYQYMKNFWSPDNAARKIIQLSKQILTNKSGKIDIAHVLRL